MATTSALSSYVERERQRLLDDLCAWLRIPSVSTLPEHAGDCRRAAEWLRERLDRLGFATELIATERHPILWAVGPEVPGAPTLLIYGHYDVQPPDPLEEWVSPPFEPAVRDGNLYARGAADDKGQVFTVVSALEAVHRLDGRLPLNVRLLIEGEEEVGSRSLTSFLLAEPDRTAADAVLVPDVHMVARGHPSVNTALRGIVHAEIHVRTLEKDLHSGLYGGAAPNAIETLGHLLEALKGPDGRIRVPGLYDRVARPTKQELAAWRRLPIKEAAFRKEAGAKGLTGERRYTFLERIWARPTFEIHGIVGGFTGAGAKTVIPAEATAKCSLRLVPDQRAKEVAKLFERAVKRAAPKYAEVSVRILSTADPFLTPLEAWPFGVLDTAFREVFRRAVAPIRSGGSIPIVPLLQQRRAPVLLTGIGLPDDGLHAPNEKLTLEQLWKGIALFGRFVELMAQGPNGKR
jgi:acetylornithine deacetylase/succinyl-diaminopimelate desuccinylase-like protein